MMGMNEHKGAIQKEKTQNLSSSAFCLSNKFPGRNQHKGLFGIMFHGPSHGFIADGLRRRQKGIQVGVNSREDGHGSQEAKS